MARYFARVKAMKDKASFKCCCIMLRQAMQLEVNCWLAVLFLHIYEYITVSACIVSCWASVRPWTNPTCALADLAAFVQHLLLDIKCLGLWNIGQLPLRITFARAAYNDTFLECNAVESSTNNILWHLLPEHRRRHRLLRMSMIQCLFLAQHMTAC